MSEGWTYKKLGEVAIFVNDGDWIESKDQSDKGIRLIQTGNVGNGIFKSKEDKPHFISEETMSRLGCTEIFEGDCLVSRLPDPVGRACLIPNTGCRMITAVDCSIIRFGNNYIPKFFVDYSQSLRYRNSIDNNTTGTTRKRISRKNLEKIPIPVPPLSEQERIVSELDLLSSIIEKKKAQLKELDNLAQSIFYDMFGDPVTNEKGWNYFELSHIYKFIDYRGKTPNKTTNGVPLITARNIRKGAIDYSIREFISESEHYNRLTRGTPHKGDLLFTTEAPLGNAAIADIDYYATAQRLIVFQIKEKALLHNTYVLYHILSDKFQNDLLKQATGSTIKGIKASKLEKIKIPLPPLSLQQKFAEKIEAIEHQKELIKQSIKETETLFNSRMDYYFN